MDFHSFLRERRTVRSFKTEAVPAAVLQRILETATRAPSAHNRQPWRFVVLASLASRDSLARAMGAAHLHDLLADGYLPQDANAEVERSVNRIHNAPLGIVICLDEGTFDPYPDEQRRYYEFLMGVQSVALAGGMLLLAAHAEGLGGVWMCAPLFTPETVRQELGLPPNWHPQGLLLLGYPAKIPNPRPRRAVGEITRFL